MELQNLEQRKYFRKGFFVVKWSVYIKIDKENINLLNLFDPNENRLTSTYKDTLENYTLNQKEFINKVEWTEIK